MRVDWHTRLSESDLKNFPFATVPAPGAPSLDWSDWNAAALVLFVVRQRYNAETLFGRFVRNLESAAADLDEPLPLWAALVRGVHRLPGHDHPAVARCRGAQASDGGERTRKLARYLLALLGEAGLRDALVRDGIALDHQAKGIRLLARAIAAGRFRRLATESDAAARRRLQAYVQRRQASVRVRLSEKDEALAQSKRANRYLMGGWGNALSVYIEGIAPHFVRTDPEHGRPHCGRCQRAGLTSFAFYAGPKSGLPLCEGHFEAELADLPDPAVCAACLRLGRETRATTGTSDESRCSTHVD